MLAGHAEEEMPRVAITRRSAITFVLFILSGVAFLYFVLPKLSGRGRDRCIGSSAETPGGSRSGWSSSCSPSPATWCSSARCSCRGPSLIGWRESYQITMAGLAATRLFAAAGAGGVALTAWALRRSGMEARLVACRMVAFMVLLYVIYAGSLLLDGVGLGTGLFPGGGSFAITIVPAIVAAILFAVVGAMALLPGDIERRLGRWAAGSGRSRTGWPAR